MKTAADTAALRPLREDAHKREEECVAKATALGARVSLAKLFFLESWLEHCGLILYNR